MRISSALFIRSSNSLKKCPAPEKPEFGFIGRSNVGKSSLINMLTGNNRLAKTSGTPGKTKTINHFLINGSWYLVDLPGYGFAKVSAGLRQKWLKLSEDYISRRETLLYLFVLVDSRLKPQKPDMKLMTFLGINQIPFARVFTKCDKLTRVQLTRSIGNHDTEMLKTWEVLPPTFISSAADRTGREEILKFIEETINNFSNIA